MATGSDGNRQLPSLTLKTIATKRQQSTGTLISPSLQAPQPIPTLSLDCIAEILSRLPLKLLFQLRCQCKFFNSLFSNPNFARQHLRYSTKCHHLMVSSSNYKGRLLFFDSPIASDFSTNSTLSPTNITYPKCLQIGYWASSSCDGILCLTTCKGSAAILWNPSLRTFKRLPRLVNKPSLSAYSFGYDHFINKYKVVAMSFFKDKCEVRVLTLGMYSWRKIQDFPYCGVFFGLGIFVGGTVNWLPIDNVSSLHVIVSLDLKKESYQKIQHPNLENDDWTLGALKDCLCIYASSGNNRFLDVWIMNEYGNKESWTKLYCVPHMGKWGICDYTKTLYISDNDQLLMAFYELGLGQLKLKLVVYDSKNGTFMIPEIQNLNRRMAIKVYIESLLSPCS
ncbi:F-box/kelch-repeat protein [Trifolium pratense]|uniref:F-box/kelch-repeat protein n=1 Tax=Trifolium pratense TaxID=57577 RepID=A0A2K3LLL2_TRIPR|nr:F-box/kelch-repeat protein [Trifolium pratense]